MKIENDALLDEFRHATRCGWCGKATPQGADPHHVYSKGAGRVDLRCNLVSLCRSCHSAHHAGARPLRCDLLAVVAARERVLQQDVTDVVQLFRRLPKGCSWERFEWEAAGLGEAEGLALREWFEMPEEYRKGGCT